MINIFQNILIFLRESLLDFILRISPNDVLNPFPLNSQNENCAELILEIKSAINNFKIEAIDESGRHVDYGKLRETNVYQNYLKEVIPKLHNLDLAELKNEEESTAFWINLYNALIIHAVIAFGVKKSLMEGGPQNMARFFRRAAYKINGMRFSLDDIEHGILRGNRGHPSLLTPQFRELDPRKSFVSQNVDPRIHFAINCASVSCPPIGVYTPDKLDVQLDLAARNFIHNEVTWENNRLTVSPILKWYSVDFGGKKGVMKFLDNYLPEGDERRGNLNLNNRKNKIHYTTYDWELNL